MIKLIMYKINLIYKNYNIKKSMSYYYNFHLDTINFTNVGTILFDNRSLLYFNNLFDNYDFDMNKLISMLQKEEKDINERNNKKYMYCIIVNPNIITWYEKGVITKKDGPSIRKFKLDISFNIIIKEVYMLNGIKVTDKPYSITKKYKHGKLKSVNYKGKILNDKKPSLIKKNSKVKLVRWNVYHNGILYYKDVFSENSLYYVTIHSNIPSDMYRSEGMIFSKVDDTYKLNYIKICNITEKNIIDDISNKFKLNDMVSIVYMFYNDKNGDSKMCYKSSLGKDIVIDSKVISKYFVLPKDINDCLKMYDSIVWF